MYILDLDIFNMYFNSPIRSIYYKNSRASEQKLLRGKRLLKFKDAVRDTPVFQRSVRESLEAMRTHWDLADTYTTTTGQVVRTRRLGTSLEVDMPLWND